MMRRNMPFWLWFLYLVVSDLWKHKHWVFWYALTIPLICLPAYASLSLLSFLGFAFGILGFSIGLTLHLTEGEPPHIFALNYTHKKLTNGHATLKERYIIESGKISQLDISAKDIEEAEEELDNYLKKDESYYV